MKIKIIAFVLIAFLGNSVKAAEQEAYGDATKVGNYPNQKIECRGQNNLCWKLSADGCEVTVYFSHGAETFEVVEIVSSSTNEPVVIEDIPDQCYGEDYIVKVLPIEE